MAKNRLKIGQQITKVFKELVDEYLDKNQHDNDPDEQPIKTKSSNNTFDNAKEHALIKEFLASPCSCGKACKDKLDFDEIAIARKEFNSLSWVEKNMFMLSQLHVFARHSNQSRSGRQTKNRVRQKFDYHISIDRPVCKKVFLFYYGETVERLKRLQKHKLDIGISTTAHGNTGRLPSHACSIQDIDLIKQFIINYAAAHGMPDKARDLRHGFGRLRMERTSILNYRSVHHAYELSLQSQNQSSVGYRTFIRCWIDTCPYIVFNQPRTDLCITCENFKKEINKIVSDLDDKRDDEKSRIYKRALDHLEDAKKERSYYTACTQLAEKHYLRLGLKNMPTRSIKPNSRNIMQHYSWDFAQQLHYPYEDQQVGSIYFKTPRKAQLFGICCEGM
ncbi:conserved hypothetical protein [Beggiatoa sp. PS]|nr:conserved hypothetical protein [Beggiatoa sp. PS]